MRAFGCVDPGRTVGWMDKQIPEPGPYDALVRPIAVAPCTSDVHNAYEIGPLRFLNRRVLGHEALAEIVKVGSGVSEFKPGDRIVVPSITPDWRNPSIEDTPHQHNKKSGDAFKFAFTIDGCFSEYFIVPDVEMNAAFLPPALSHKKALMACDMMSTGLHGVELAEIQFGESVAVMGLGPVGLMAVAGSALRGAGHIFCVENKRMQDRIAIAKQYGATDFLDYKDEDFIESFKEATNKRGVDKVIIAGGNADTFANAVRVVRPGGIIANINVYTKIDSLPIPVSAWGAGLSHKTIKGGLCPGGRRRMEKMLALLETGRIDPSALITHTFDGFDQIEDAFYLMRDKPPGLIKPAVFLE